MKPACYGRAEVQIVVAHRFLEFPGMFVRQEHPGHVRLNGFHFSGTLRIRYRPAQECDFFFDGPIVASHPIFTLCCTLCSATKGYSRGAATDCSHASPWFFGPVTMSPGGATDFSRIFRPSGA